ncbi:hypothetical protein ACIP2X_15900 [Streptomyces sp. NPDC089424]|uniref:hypothetical protein n=1 Tax=Streptomyces sp. NPDC089424 TaxID=3365917 RepID=UPI0037F5F27A
MNELRAAGVPVRGVVPGQDRHLLPTPRKRRAAHLAATGLVTSRAGLRDALTGPSA